MLGFVFCWVFLFGFTSNFYLLNLSLVSIHPSSGIIQSVKHVQVSVSKGGILQQLDLRMFLVHVEGASESIYVFWQRA